MFGLRWQGKKHFMPIFMEYICTRDRMLVSIDFAEKTTVKIHAVNCVTRKLQNCLR